MANDLNQCNFIGRLGRDPETRYMPNGDAVTGFSLAVGWKGKDKEGCEWVNIVAYGKLAEICNEYLHKGSQVYISGSMRTEKWQDKQGNDRYTTKIVADKMQMLGGKQEAAERDPPRERSERQPAKEGGHFDDIEGDIPF